MQNRHSEIKLTKCNIVQMKSHFSTLVLFGTLRGKPGEQKVVKSIQTSSNLQIIIQQKKKSHTNTALKESKVLINNRHKNHCKKNQPLLWYNTDCMGCAAVSVSFSQLHHLCHWGIVGKSCSTNGLLENSSNQSVSAPPILFLPSLHPQPFSLNPCLQSLSRTSQVSKSQI